MPERDVDEVQQSGGVDEAALAVAARHALHDEELVVALAAGALQAADEADDRTRARGFVDRCPACRALHDDVAAIGASLHATAAFTAKAPRDYRLTVDDALRLGGTVITRGVLGRMRDALLGVARPFGASIAAIGLVGVLVGGAAFGAGGSAAGPTSGQAGSNVPGAAPSSVDVAFASEATTKATERNEYGVAVPGSDDGPAPTAWLLIGSVVAIVLGLALFVAGTRAGARGGRRARSP